ncbi:alpha/beta hydrolase [Streptomyces sp. RGM 3693]|uniref:alpha/beta hydrolase n=1 Tax=Streptomyces sp. RGM 3693 TaxID=3413284 RepID=UPI003D2C75CD
MTTAATASAGYLDELRDLVMLHARAQGLPPDPCRTLLSRIRTPDGDSDGPGSWAGEWCAAGDRLAARGRLLDACRHYALGRFPYVDGPGRQRAQGACTAAFDRWRRGSGGRRIHVERLTVTHPAGTQTAWAAGLGDPARPLLLITGGIVSVKEQWAPLLRLAPVLGMAVVAAELPGVGEHTARYGPDAHLAFTALLDTLTGRADTTRTHALALSFSGHLALRCALDDPRIRSVATVGAPLGPFFRDPAWRRHVPQTTRRTLDHLTDGTTDHVLPELALTGAQLRSLDVDVAYVASLRDEIVPLTEVGLLRRTVARSRALVLDDVHGAPAHLAVVRPYLLAHAVRAARAHPARRALFGGLAATARARRALPGGTA